jgi:S1-C subfamily serine protease
MTGEVIGINDQIDSGGTVNGNVGVGFAVANNMANTVVPRLIATGHAVKLGCSRPQEAYGSRPSGGYHWRAPCLRVSPRASLHEVPQHGNIVTIAGTGAEGVSTTSRAADAPKHTENPRHEAGEVAEKDQW